MSSEMIGLAVAALILLLTFGTVVAAGLPIATALFGLGISSALIGLLAGVLDVPDWASPTAAIIGIGVGIDYALLIVTRFRAARAGGSDAHEAAVEAIATAGPLTCAAIGRSLANLNDKATSVSALAQDAAA